MPKPSITVVRKRKGAMSMTRSTGRMRRGGGGCHPSGAWKGDGEAKRKTVVRAVPSSLRTGERDRGGVVSIVTIGSVTRDWQYRSRWKRSDIGKAAEYVENQNNTKGFLA